MNRFVGGDADAPHPIKLVDGIVQWIVDVLKGFKIVSDSVVVRTTIPHQAP
jgi:hypothetical protein